MQHGKKVLREGILFKSSYGYAITHVLRLEFFILTVYG